MGCFLGCFGGSKDRRRRKQRNRVIPRDKQQSHGCPVSHLKDTVTEQRADNSSPINLVSELRDKPEENSSSSGKKRVTFDSNVKTYEHVKLYESNDSWPESKSVADEEIAKVSAVGNKESLISSEENSVASSVGSYPPNYRYQNCRDSDDEIEEVDDSDLDDDDDNDNEYEEDCLDDDDNLVETRFVGQNLWSESVSNAFVESRKENLSSQATSRRDSDQSPIDMSTVATKDMKIEKPPLSPRDRSDYIHSVLSPVENLTQWKTVKSRGASQHTPQKENFSLESEAAARISFSSEPTIQRSSTRAKSNDQVAVDASLSTWLSATESTPSRTNSVETVTSEMFKKSSPNSVRNLEDRPILGALTVEELKQLAASSSPRKSPSRSPDDMPIIGTVGTYWNDSIASKDSKSIPSYKGIPNTNSKYREDKKVNWHSTPFEKRLEQALNRGSGEV